MPIQLPSGPPNNAQSYPGAPAGVIQVATQHEIPDEGAYMIQDGLVHHPGEIRRRGPVQSSVPALSYMGCGLAATTAPDGISYVAALSGDDTHGVMQVLDESLTNILGSMSWANNLPISSGYRIFHARPAIKLGTMIGVSNTAALSSPGSFSKGTITLASSLSVSALYNKTITIGPDVYTLKQTIVNGTPNQIRMSSSSGAAMATAIAAAINDSGVGKGTNYSSATTANTRVTATVNGLVITLTALTAGSGGNYALSTSYTGTYLSVLGMGGGTGAGSGEQALAYWAGGKYANYVGTLSTTRGSATVTGSGTTFLANVSPGMWLIASNAMIGCVRSVESNTSLTLTEGATTTVASVSGTFQSLRGIYPKVSVGELTCATGSTAVTGGATKFIGQGLNTGTWDLFRKSDMTFIGTVSTVASEFSLTLTANATISLASEAYIALKRGGAFWGLATTDSGHVGVLSAAYAGRQWYANRATSTDEHQRVWFSSTDDPEILDTSVDGDWLTVPSSGNQPHTAIIGLVACYNSLLVLKRNEAFAIYGKSSDTFTLRGVGDDGTISTMSAVQYQNGAVWAGYGGIYYYDGAAVQNIIENNLGDYWRTLIKDFDSEKQRAWGFVYRDHYVLFLEAVSSNVPIIKGATTTYPTNWTVVVNLKTGAATFLTNVPVRGSVELPGSLGGRLYFLVNTTVGRLCPAFDLFEGAGVDQFSTDVGTAGPDFYFESKKFGMEDPLILKRFKQLTVHHLNTGDGIVVDTIRGLDNVGVTLTSQLTDTSGTWMPQRLRFSKKTQYFSFRMYQNSLAISRLIIGPYQLKYKSLRLGRV